MAFSADNRQIVSGARDKTIKLWNTLGVCKYTIQEDGHAEWVSCVRFSPNTSNPIIVSCGWDKLVKVSVQLSFLVKQKVSVPSSDWIGETVEGLLRNTSFQILLSFDEQKFADHISQLEIKLVVFVLLGLEPDQLQTEDQPHRSLWIFELRYRFSRWFSVCLWRKGKTKENFQERSASMLCESNFMKCGQ